MWITHVPPFAPAPVATPSQAAAFGAAGGAGGVAGAALFAFCEAGEALEAGLGEGLSFEQPAVRATAITTAGEIQARICMV